MKAGKVESVAVVICAGGSSSRMGGIKKEYQKLDNSPGALTVLGSCVCAFASVASVGVIAIAIPQDTEDQARSALPPEFEDTLRPKIVFVAGGSSRRASVFNALCALDSFDPGYVLIHDGARPWVSLELIQNVIEKTEKNGAVIPLLPLVDTPKECDTQIMEDGQVFIKNHLKRSNTGIAQTPQGFSFKEILKAHEKACGEDEDFTDDAEIWGRYCGPVAVVPGSPENRKITYPEDL